jgi:hypothetical protein
MGKSKEQFLDQQQRAFLDIDCSDNLFEEWMEDEIHLGGEHSVHVSLKDIEVDYKEVSNTESDDN